MRKWFVWECTECGNVFESKYGDCPNEQTGLETHATKQILEFTPAYRSKSWWFKSILSSR